MAKKVSDFQEAVGEIEQKLQKKKLMFILSVLSVTFAISCMNIFLLYSQKPSYRQDPAEVPKWVQEELQKLHNQIDGMKTNLKVLEERVVSPEEVERLFNKNIEASIKLILTRNAEVKKQIDEISNLHKEISQKIKNLQK